MIRVVAKRYAKALVDLSEQKKITDKVRADFGAFAEAVKVQKDIQKLFINPAFTPENKKAVIRDLSSRLQLHPLVQHFIEYLVDVNRIRYVAEFHAVFTELLAERQNRAIAKLTTAAPIPDGTVDAIKQKLESLTKKQVEIDAEVDPSLIGGVRAQIGSVIYDGSIRNQLNKLKDHLLH